MIRKRGRIRRQLIVFGSAFGTTGELASSLWRSSGRRWMVPLAIFLCLTGLILTLCDARTSEALSAALPPTVLLNNLPVARFAAAVTVDNYRAGFELTRHILDHGHRRILVVSGHFRSSDRARLRYDGYVAAMQEAGVPPIEAVEIPSLAGGYRAFYNPGGPGPEPFPGVTYTAPGPPDVQPVTMALDDPMRVSRDAAANSPTWRVVGLAAAILAVLLLVVAYWRRGWTRPRGPARP